MEKMACDMCGESGRFETSHVFVLLSGDLLGVGIVAVQRKVGVLDHDCLGMKTPVS